MNYPIVRNLLVACGVSGSFLANPSESKAIFHWFGGGCCGGGQTAYRVPTTAYYVPTTAYYVPTTAYYAPACNTCCTQQVASYVPQTSYRAQCVNMPVTTYRPVVASDPCTGCPVTVMRPVTSYVQQVQYVPYTSYRVVYSPVTTGCCTTAAYYAPAAYAPTAPACCAPATTVTPSYPAAPAAPPIEGERTTQPDINLKVPLAPVPGDENQKTAPMSTAPRLIDPATRFTARPMPRVEAKAISLPREAPAADDGWRASNR